MVEIKSILTNNDCYKAGKKMTLIKGVLWHSTATPGATPETFAKSWNVPKPNGRQVCVHSFSDDTKVIQTLPYDMRCWGCGGAGNNYYIQNEICEPKEVYFVNGWTYATKDKEKTAEYVRKAFEVCCQWTVDRLLELGIKEVNKTTVTSHYEGYSAGIASNHSDPKGLLGLAGLSMDKARERCKEIMAERLNKKEETVKEKVSTNIKVGSKVRLVSGAKQYNGKAIKKGYETKEYVVKEIKDDRVVLTIDNIVIYAININSIKLVEEVVVFKPFLVKVTADALNIRKGPSTRYSITGVIRDKGVYTIVETNGDWGKLKSGAGWIHLGYTKKV